MAQSRPLQTASRTRGMASASVADSTSTDVVTFYDTRSLEVVGEAVIPPKRATGMPHRAYNGMSDDGRFVYVANMTPATSVSVVDTKTKSFAEEVPTPGCALVYPTGSRSFASLCGDGTALSVRLDANGHAEPGQIKFPIFTDPPVFGAWNQIRRDLPQLLNNRPSIA